jgi:hypothetical protein
MKNKHQGSREIWLHHHNTVFAKERMECSYNTWGMMQRVEHDFMSIVYKILKV